MRGRRRGWFVDLFLTVALTQAVYSGTRVLVSYRALGLGANVTDIGVITAAYALVPVLVALAIGRAVDRNLAALVLRAGIVLTALAVVIVAVSDSLPVLVCGYVLLGFGQMLATVASQGFAAILADLHDLDRTFAGVTMAISLGQTVGIPVVGVLVATTSGPDQPRTTPALLVMAALALAALPTALRLRHRNREASTAVNRTPPLSAVAMLGLRGMKPAVLSGLMVLVSVDLLTVYLPVLGEEHGISVIVITILLTLRSFASLVSRFLLPWLLRVVPRSAMLVSATGCSAWAMLLIPAFPHPVVIGVMMVVAGSFWGIGQPLVMTWVIGLVPRPQQATALSLRLMGNRVGQVVLPLGAGAMAGAAGVGAVFVLAAGMLTVSAVSTWQSVTSRGAAS